MNWLYISGYRVVSVNWQERVRPLFRAVCFITILKFEWCHISKKSECIIFCKRALCMKYAYGHQRQRILAKPRPCGVFILHGSICWLVSLCFARVFASAFALLFICAAGARIDHNPPFFAFSSRLHFPKSVYEGNFGCGYLKERRASGLVFCENTTSVYRALFVSPSVFLLPFVSNGDCQSVALLMPSAQWWNDVACSFHFLAWFQLPCIYFMFLL